MLEWMYRHYDGDNDLTSEHGYHRLVRISPFDPQARRQTSFALVGPRRGRNARTEQVRTYVLDPYTLARNMRDDRSVDDAVAVLRGDRLGELLS